MNRIRKYIKENPTRKLLIPFFTAGFPNWNIFLELISAAINSGADFIEIGVPFSDPLADGPEIQYSSFVSLSQGTTLKKILQGVETLRNKSDVPFILMGYYNPILTYGDAKFMSDSKKAGVDGLIVPDLSIAEASGFKQLALKNRLSTIFLVSPTSSNGRIRQIEKFCSDFVYAVTVTGVTGAGKTFDKQTDNYLKHLRLTLQKKFVAGFGVSSAETARRLAANSDGIVIGSRLVTIIRESKTPKQAAPKVEQLLKQIRKALL
jgi:tryptophan synthase alpha chain